MKADEYQQLNEDDEIYVDAVVAVPAEEFAESRKRTARSGVTRPE